MLIARWVSIFSHFKIVLNHVVKFCHFSDFDQPGTDWSEWTKEEDGKGGVSYSRYRGCLGVLPIFDGFCGPLPYHQKIDCQSGKCYREYTQWSEWSDCQTDCDNETGIRTRDRACLEKDLNLDLPQICLDETLEEKQCQARCECKKWFLKRGTLFL